MDTAGAEFVFAVGRKQAYPVDMADVAHPFQWADSKWSPADSECPKSNQ